MNVARAAQQEADAAADFFVLKVIEDVEEPHPPAPENPQLDQPEQEPMDMENRLDQLVNELGPVDIANLLSRYTSKEVERFSFADEFVGNVAQNDNHEFVTTRDVRKFCFSNCIFGLFNCFNS